VTVTVKTQPTVQSKHSFHVRIISTRRLKSLIYHQTLEKYYFIAFFVIPKSWYWLKTRSWDSGLQSLEMTPLSNFHGVVVPECISTRSLQGDFSLSFINKSLY